MSVGEALGGFCSGRVVVILELQGQAAMLDDRAFLSAGRKYP